MTHNPGTSLWDPLRLLKLWARSGARSDRTSICLPSAASGQLCSMGESQWSKGGSGSYRRRAKFDSASGAAQRCNRSADSHVVLERQFLDAVACSAEQWARSVRTAIVTCSARWSQVLVPTALKHAISWQLTSVMRDRTYIKPVRPSPPRFRTGRNATKNSGTVRGLGPGHPRRHVQLRGSLRVKDRVRVIFDDMCSGTNCGEDWQVKARTKRGRVGAGARHEDTNVFALCYTFLFTAHVACCIPRVYRAT